MRRGVLIAAAATVVALVVLAAGLALGLSAGSSSSTTAASTLGSVASVTSVSSGTSTEPTQPAVTVVTSTTDTTDTTALPGYEKPPVALGDGNTPEQFIVGSLYYDALQQRGYQVSLTRNIGTPQTALAALKQGSLDLFPEYVDQWDTQVAGLSKQFPTLAATVAAANNYAEHHGEVLLPPTPFSDTGGIAVTSEYAAANHVASVTDLAAGPSIILAAPLEFLQGPQGLPALEHAYGLRPGYVQVVDIGSQYGVLAAGDAQAAYASTTDPQLLGPEYQLLTDPDHVLGFGNVVPVTTAHVLSAEGPAFLSTIEEIDAALTTTAMRGLNYEVEVLGHNPFEVASEFLQGEGIDPPVIYAPVPATTTTPTDTTTTTDATATGTAPVTNTTPVTTATPVTSTTPVTTTPAVTTTTGSG